MLDAANPFEKINVQLELAKVVFARTARLLMERNLHVRHQPTYGIATITTDSTFNVSDATPRGENSEPSTNKQPFGLSFDAATRQS